MITTKGDIVETWKLIIKGRIVSDEDLVTKNSATVSDVPTFTNSSHLKSTSGKIQT